MDNLPQIEIKSFLKDHPLKKIHINGKEWEYIVCGKGTIAFLLLPGGGQTAQSNFQLIDAFKDNYKIICPTIYDVDSIEEFCQAIIQFLLKRKLIRLFSTGYQLVEFLHNHISEEIKRKL